MDKSDISSERRERGTCFKKKSHEVSAPFCCKWHSTGPTASPAGLKRHWAICGSLSQLLVCLPFSSQTKDALLKILDDVKEEDYLNFILFSGDVITWKDNLVQATPENIQEARTFVRNIQDQGSKNRGESRCSHCSSL